MSEAAAEDKIDAVEKLTKKRLKIKDAIDTAIKKFSSSLPKDEDNNQYAKILDELMVAINKDRDIIAKELEKSGKKPTKKSDPELVSKQMSLDDVIKFIDSNSNAIFVVTGGSFNPPHNGHIGMFQKAYDQLKDKGKEVYGVMVPASEDWLNKKVADGKLVPPQKIDIKDRVDLCKLSCDSYEWTNSTKFNASNMIVVNEGGNDPATSILQTDKTVFRDNAYYLCGSDYYAGHGTDTYKFICVLRSGVKVADLKMTFDKAPTEDKAKTDFDVKPDDIIIEGGSVDNDASSTSLRNMLTEINKIVVKDGGLTGDLPDNDKFLALISIPVLRKLLELKYILTDADKVKIELMGIKFEDIIEDDVHVEHTDKPVHYLSTGIKNGPAFCYLNSAFQLLFSIETLKNWVGAADLDKLKGTTTRIERCAIKLLKLIIKSSNTPKETVTGGDKLKTRIETETKKTAGSEFRVGDQNDSHEVLVPIIDAFLTKHPDSVKELKFTEYDLQTKDGGATTKGTTVRTKCITDPINITIDTVNSIQTALDNNKSTAKARKSDMDPTEVDLLTEFQYQFETDNRYFIIYLNRTSTTEVGGMNKKPITVDKHITVTQKQAPPPDTAAEKVYKFKLRGAILKSGSAKGGHYKYISYENGADEGPITYDSPNVYPSIGAELKGDNSIECYSSIFLYEKDS